MDVLAKQIVAGISGDRAKALAIFRWIATNIAYDSESLKNGSYRDLPPELVLRSRRAVCSGYSSLFNAMATAVGLESVRIRGYSKGFEYIPGKGNGDKPNHAWNAVKIDGRWMLVDATWGAGYLDSDLNFVRAYEEHYFLTPPEEFIFDHLPDDPKWQLLAKPISKTEYSKLVDLWPAFYQNGLRVIDNGYAVISTHGLVKVDFSAPESTILTADILDGGRPVSGSKTFVQREAGALRVYALAPAKGVYTLRIYAKQSGEADSFAEVIEYKIESDGVAETGDGLPKAFGAFLPMKVRLFSPMSYNLPASKVTKFELRVPGAKDVVVESGGTITHLIRSADRFEGEAMIVAGSTQVYAKYEDGTRYKGLVEYESVR